MGSPGAGATFTGIPQPPPPCTVCGGQGWIWEEVKVEVTTVDAGGHTTLVHWEWEQVTCDWCGGDGLEPPERLSKPAQAYKAIKYLFRLFRGGS